MDPVKANGALHVRKFLCVWGIDDGVGQVENFKDAFEADERTGHVDSCIGKRRERKVDAYDEQAQGRENSCVDVVWFVRCEIGPDWIGGGRDIQLYQNGDQLSGTCCDDLISAIITAASTPSESSESVISGEGKLSLRDEKLTLEFEWNDTAPYDDPRNSGNGTVELDASS